MKSIINAGLYDSVSDRAAMNLAAMNLAATSINAERVPLIWGTVCNMLMFLILLLILIAVMWLCLRRVSLRFCAELEIYAEPDEESRTVGCVRLWWLVSGRDGLRVLLRRQLLPHWMFDPFDWDLAETAGMVEAALRCWRHIVADMAYLRRNCTPGELRVVVTPGGDAAAAAVWGGAIQAVVGWLAAACGDADCQSSCRINFAWRNSEVAAYPPVKLRVRAVFGLRLLAVPGIFRRIKRLQTEHNKPR